MFRKILTLLTLTGFCYAGCFAQAVKKPEFSGTWYPRNRRTLNNSIDKYISNALVPQINGDVLGIISPHAGYVYSGSIAGYSYKILSQREYDVVILLGPSHKYNFKGISIYPDGMFITPLGNLPVDVDTAGQFESLAITQYNKDFFNKEHSLEVQMPFIYKIFGGIKIVPVLFGKLSYNEIQSVSKRIYEISHDKKVLVVVSSDLSHFHGYAKANSIDKDTVNFITNQDDLSLWQKRQDEGGRACGFAPIITLINYSKLKNARLSVLKYSNSGDTSSNKDSVVGYLSAVVFNGTLLDSKEACPMQEYTLSDQEKKYLLDAARKTLQSYLKNKKVPKLDVPGSSALNSDRGAFVTLKKNGQLRGCIGRIVGDTAVYRVVQEFAMHSATDDPRFPAVRHDELDEIEIEISVLTPFEEVKDLDEIEVGKHGLMIKKWFSQGLLLPQVPVEWGWDKKEFLEQTCVKAGLSKDAYKDQNVTIYKFSAIVFNESQFKD